MKIEIPENIDLNRPGKYNLLIEVHPEQYSFMLYDWEDRQFDFYYKVPGSSESNDSFANFKEMLFNNEFFSLSFNKVYIINYATDFTYVPEILFREKDQKKYINFLFHEKSEYILSYVLKDQGIVIIHPIAQCVYEFFQRTFVNAKIIHHTAPLISFFQDNGSFLKNKRMVINKRGKGMDILCFSGNQFLLGNHFDIPLLNDAIYNTLFVWKQLKFDQHTDYLYIAEDSRELFENLQKYIKHIYFQESVGGLPFEASKIPYEMFVLAVNDI